MDGVPAPISMLVDPSVNPEAIALVSMMILTLMTLIKGLFILHILDSIIKDVYA